MMAASAPVRSLARRRPDPRIDVDANVNRADIRIGGQETRCPP
jgi:hypothetical protein